MANLATMWPITKSPFYSLLTHNSLLQTRGL